MVWNKYLGTNFSNFKNCFQPLFFPFQLLENYNYIPRSINIWSRLNLQYTIQLHWRYVIIRITQTTINHALVVLIIVELAEWSLIIIQKLYKSLIIIQKIIQKESDNPGSSPGRGKALCPWDMREKKNASSTFRLN